VSLFVLSPEIEDRGEVEVGNWAKHKKTSTPRICEGKTNRNIASKITTESIIKLRPVLRA
jgi:hypothetical protein